MNTPIYSFAKKYSEQQAVRLHMPGHKGVNTPLGIEHLDITEFDGADNLWAPEGIILESEANASSLFGADTFYSTEGSSLCIRAMLFMVKKWAYKNNISPFILAARNAHKTFINAAAILDIDVDWLMQKENDTYESCTIDADDISKYLETASKKPVAVYITSPDYLGNMSDVESIAKVCHDNNILLLVDNAHGAYLKFLEKSLHPMDLGADICCDSAHKTLPALTGAAYLHVSIKADKFFHDTAREALSLFASTSPSYLIMESLDLTNEYLERKHEKAFAQLTKLVGEVKARLMEGGFTLKGSEPIKVTIDTLAYGYTGQEIADILRSNNIFLEYYDTNFIVAMFSTGSSFGDTIKFTEALLNIPRREPVKVAGITVSKPVQAISPAQALYMETETIPSSESVGRILARTAVSCPPCVPVYIAGEVISQIPDTEYISVIKKG